MEKWGERERLMVEEESDGKGELERDKNNPPPNPNKMRTSTGVLRRNNKRLSNRKKQLDLEGEKIRPKNTNWGRIR